MTGIPIIDFSAAATGTSEQKANTAKQIDDAFRNVGFVYLKNHGVPLEKVEECFEWSKKFFALPMSTKMLAPHPRGGSHHRGYSAPGFEKISRDEDEPNEKAGSGEVPDFKESFESGNVDDESQPNIWLPNDELPGFRAFMETYFSLCADLVHRILDSLSIALDLQNGGLSPMHSKSLFQLRLLHYPPVDAGYLAENKHLRFFPHSDFGTLTLLFQDSVGGLEIQDQHNSSHFRSASPIKDTVLVNIGDLLARWSNDRWRSTVHRVALPEAFADGKGTVPDRYSIPFFATANMGTVVEALPGCWDERGNHKKYEPVTAWGYVQMRMAEIYDS